MEFGFVYKCEPQKMRNRSLEKSTGENGSKFLDCGTKIDSSLVGYSRMMSSLSSGKSVLDLRETLCYVWG